jgi:hypothetical protein
MKKYVFSALVLMAAIQTIGFSQTKKGRESLKNDTISVDSVEYSLIIIDPGFDIWLAAKPSKNFYSNNYYVQKNRFYVDEWNLRYTTENNNGLYDNYIDYNPDADYGIDINYRLYYYFKYFEETNHVKLLPFIR